MKHIVSEELKNDIFNLRMVVGIVLIVVVSLISTTDMFQKLIDLGNSPEGPGWYVAYRYCIYAFNTLLIIPIAVPLAAGENTEAELRSRFSLFSYIRAGKKPYLISKTLGLILSGGLMVLGSMVIMMIFSIVGFRNIQPLDLRTINMSEIYIWLISTFPIGFLNGAFWALIGGLAAVITKNKHMAYTVPFILYYVLTVFQERYYRKLFYLSPRYWVDSYIYGELPCVLILLVLTIFVSILFMKAVKRRLDNA